MTAVREVVPSAMAGERLDRVVAMVTGVSRSAAAGLVAAGAVRVDGEVAAGRAGRLEAGATVEVELSDAPATAGPAADPAVAVVVVHADTDVVVVDKPAGLVVHPGAGNTEGTLAAGLLARYPEVAAVGQPGRPGIVHRLDKQTSGLLAVARSTAGYDGLVAQLAARQVGREYLALVWGRPEAPAGMVDAPIGRSTREPTRMAVSARGREARTRYQVERAYSGPEEVSLLRCRLETGRTHQIRVHLAAIGHPVVGDRRYGGHRQGLPVPRPFLHAARLSFTHPVTEEPLEFTSPLPADLTSVLAALTRET